MKGYESTGAQILREVTQRESVRVVWSPHYGWAEQGGSK